MKLLSTLIASLLLAVSGMAHAQQIQEKHLLSGKEKLDPQSGYILISTPTEMHGTFMRIPDASDWEYYRKTREARLEEAKKEYPGKLATWQKQADRAVMEGRKPFPRPVEPNAETFSIGPIERFMRDSFGIYQFSKDKKVPVYRYLIGVKPGTYAWFGPTVPGIAFPNPDYCNCMGTVKFEVKAGVITDLGDFLMTVARRDGLTGKDKVDAAGGVFSTSRDGQGEVGAEAARYGVPPSLSALPAVRAEFHASGKINNFDNITVNRVRPIPGILGYDRDTVIDLRTGARLTSEFAVLDPDPDSDQDAAAETASDK